MAPKKKPAAKKGVRTPARHMLQPLSAEYSPLMLVAGCTPLFQALPSLSGRDLCMSMLRPAVITMITATLCSASAEPHVKAVTKQSGAL